MSKSNFRRIFDCLELFLGNMVVEQFLGYIGLIFMAGALIEDELLSIWEKDITRIVIFRIPTILYFWVIPVEKVILHREKVFTIVLDDAIVIHWLSIFKGYLLTLAIEMLLAASGKSVLEM